VLYQFWIYLDGLGWLLLALGPFFFVQRWLHREIQLLFLLITRRQAFALGLFSILFFPGVLLHELSHYITARLLGVRTGHFSLLPSLMPDGKLRLGYVETAGSDVVRDALIGVAPLVAGGAAVAYLGLRRLGFSPIAEMFVNGNWRGLLQGLGNLPAQPDFWLPVILVAVSLAGIALLAGAGPWMLYNLAPWLNRALRAIATIFGASLAMHLALLIPLRALREAVMRAFGLRLAAGDE